MLNFIISFVIFVASLFLLVVAIRYGLKGASRMDAYFSQKRNSSYPGFEWYYRIPFAIGVIPEYFFALVMGHDNYFKHNWWALKTASFISVLVFIAGLKSRSALASYFSLSFLQDKGLAGFFTSGNFVLFMNIIVVLYAALFILICIESIRMYGIYSPIRIIVYSTLSLLMANLTVITLSLIVFITVVYVVIKIIGFFFFSSSRKKRDEEDETAGTILSGGLRDFKTELYQWEEEEKIRPKQVHKTTPRKPKRIKRKRPKIKRTYGGDIPRLHPD